MPCPCCGGQATLCDGLPLARNNLENPKNEEYAIVAVCAGCRFEGPMAAGARRAIEAWNENAKRILERYAPPLIVTEAA